MNLVKTWWTLALLILTFWGSSAGARPWEEIAREMEIAQANIGQAQALIVKAEGKVQTALSKVQNAERFEGPHWVELEKAMQDYTSTFKDQMRVVDFNVKNLLRANPSANIPAVDANPPQFKSSIKSMEAVREDLKRAVLKAKKFKAARQQDDAKIRLEMEQRTEEQYTDIVLDLAGVPLNGDGSIDYGDIIAGLLPGPAGLINTGLSLTFGLYYYADEMKSGVRQIKTFKEMMAYADQAIARTEADVRSSEQGLQFLNGYWQQKEDLMKDFYTLRNGWGKAAEQSRKDKKEEETREFDKGLEKPLVAAKNDRWEPPLLASEIEPEAKGVIRELESAALAAMQGGDPDAFAAILKSAFNRYKDKADQAAKTTKSAQEAAERAWQTYSAATAAAHQSYIAAIRGRCSCEREFLDAAGAAYHAACSAAYQTYLPVAQALHRAQREQSRISMVQGLISNGASLLLSQMSEYAYAASNGLHLAQSQARQSFEDVTGELGALSEGIPFPWTTQAIKDYITRLPEHVSHEFYWGASPAGLQGQLQSYATSVRTLGERMRRALPEYRRAVTEARQMASVLQGQLDAQLNKDARIIASYRDNSLSNMRWPWWNEEAWERGTDGRPELIEALKKQSEEALRLSERDDLDQVSGFDFEGAARQIEQQAEEIGHTVDRIATFNYRLASATAKLDRVSRSLTHQAVYEARTKAPEVLVAEELGSGAWAGLAQAAKQLLSQLEPLKEKGFSYPYGLGAPGVRAPMMAAQGILHIAAQVRMKHFINVRQQGGFHPVSASDFKLLDDSWKLLKPLYAQFDALAVGERPPLLAARSAFPDGASLQAAYTAIPAQHRGLVSGAYQRYHQEARTIQDYLNLKLQSLEPMGEADKNLGARQLEEWIGGYPTAQKAWEAQLARQQKEQEERKRQYEESRANQAKSHLASVQALYPRFAAAYQNRNLSELLKMLAPHWQTENGSTRRDLEDTLTNSFRLFDSISFTITGLTIQPVSEGVFQAKYSVRLVGIISRRNIRHEETSQVTDTITITAEGPVITHTTGSGIVFK